MVAVSDDNQIVAVGEQAREMIGRTPGNITAIRPMKDGVIADYVITEAMLRYFIKKAGRSFTKPDVMISVPSGVTSVEKRAVRDAALKAGAREAYLIEEPLAAAIGANVPISGAVGQHDHRHRRRHDRDRRHRPRRHRRLASRCASAATASTRRSRNYIRKKYNLMIGERTAEEVKIQIGAALPLERELHMEVRGRDLIAGLPRTIPLTSSEVMEALETPLQQIVTAVRSVLEQTPPELSSDIIDKGMVMRGGGALLRNIDKLLTQVTGVPCHVAENPLNCVALGTGPRPRALRVLQEVAGTEDLTICAETPTRAELAGRACFADLHCHTSASFDSLSKPERVVRAAAARGLTHLAITDHERIDGALAARDVAPPSLTIIVGEEIRTTECDLIGAVPRGGRSGRAARPSRRPPHPRTGRPGRPAPPLRPLPARAVARLPRRSSRSGSTLVDYIEVCNARLVGSGNDQAAELAAAQAARRCLVRRAHGHRGRPSPTRAVDGRSSRPPTAARRLPGREVGHEPRLVLRARGHAGRQDRPARARQPRSGRRSRSRRAPDIEGRPSAKRPTPEEQIIDYPGRAGGGGRAAAAVAAPARPAHDHLDRPADRAAGARYRDTFSGIHFQRLLD